jgi:hypothetical protein
MFLVGYFYAKGAGEYLYNLDMSFIKNGFIKAKVVIFDLLL